MRFYWWISMNWGFAGVIKTKSQKIVSGAVNIR